MDKTMQTMIENLQKNTGKTLEQWVQVIKDRSFAKHSEIINYLKEEHGFTHGYANLVAHTAKTDASPDSTNSESILAKQFQGKEHFRPLYEELVQIAQGFGSDVEVAPKKTYVSLRRQKQFATLQAASKIRFEIGLNLRGIGANGKLELQKENAMCTHKISVSGNDKPDQEILDWLRVAYERAS